MVHYDPYDWAIHEDPYPTYAALRAEIPAYYNAERGFWALSRHADVTAALRDAETFSSMDGPALEKLDRAATEVSSILAMDPPHHDAMRSLVWRRFTPRAVRALEPAIRELSRRYLDELAGRDSFDFIAEFAGRVPMDVISEAAGVPEEDREELRRLADLVVHRDSGSAEVPMAAVKAGMKLLQYFGRHVAKRKQLPVEERTGTLTDVLLDAEVDGERLSLTDLIAFHFLFAVAGNETTTKLLANAVYWISKHPEQRARVAADPSLISGWVEETLRYDASSQMVARTVTRDIELHGQTLKAGDRVALLLGSANRDETVYENAAAYDIDRRVTRTMAFGHGVHYCLGASLARLEGRICLEELMARAPDFRIREDQVTRVHSPNVRGFATMPMELTP